MALLEILEYPDERLARKCEPVEQVTDETRQLIDDLFETMYLSEGVGLAAAQVGVLQRVIVLDCGERDAEENEQRPLPAKEPIAVVNPSIIAECGKITWEEGCLSVPGYVDEVQRAEKVTVEGLDREGQPLSIAADGLLSVCLQHEIDHLDGILFVDRLSKLKQQLLKRRIKKQQREMD